MRITSHARFLLVLTPLLAACGASQTGSPNGPYCEGGAKGRTCTDEDGYVWRSTTDNPEPKPARDEPRRQITPR